MQTKVIQKEIAPHIYSLRLWIKCVDPEILKSTFDKLLSQTRYNVLNFCEHSFPVQGYTAIWLLAESHLAVHTFPQSTWTYVELSGCNQQKTDDFKMYMEESKFEIQWEDTNPTQSAPGIQNKHIKN